MKDNNNKIDQNNLRADIDVEKSYSWFLEEKRTLYIMLKHLPIVKPSPDCSYNDAHVKEIIDNINFDVKDKYEKMIYLNFYVVVDECISKIYKAIGMFHNELMSRNKVTVSYSDLTKHDNENDKVEMFIDIITDKKNVSGKLEDITKIFKNKFGYDIPKKFLEEMEKFRIERNVLVHSQGILNKKAISEIKSKKITHLFDSLNEGDMIEYSQEKIERLMDIVSYNIEDLNYPIIKFYDPSFELNQKDREFVENLRRKY